MAVLSSFSDVPITPSSEKKLGAYAMGVSFCMSECSEAVWATYWYGICSRPLSNYLSMMWSLEKVGINIKFYLIIKKD